MYDRLIGSSGRLKLLFCSCLRMRVSVDYSHACPDPAPNVSPTGLTPSAPSCGLQLAYDFLFRDPDRRLLSLQPLDFRLAHS